MALRLHRHGDGIYLTGAGTTGCLCWQRQAGDWTCAPAALPDGAEAIGPEEAPADLREELLAFAARAEAIEGDALSGAARRN